MDPAAAFFKRDGFFRATTFFVSEGVQDLERVVVLAAFAEAVVHEVGPEPRRPLPAAHDVAHSKDEDRHMELSILLMFPLLPSPRVVEINIENNSLVDALNVLRVGVTLGVNFLPHCGF